MPEPKLTPVPEAPLEGRPPESRAATSATPEPPRSRRWPLVTLAVGVAVLLALLVWSRLELAQTTAGFESRIQVLDAEVDALGTELRARDATIDAQRGRLDDVRESVTALQTLLDEPL